MSQRGRAQTSTTAQAHLQLNTLSPSLQSYHHACRCPTAPARNYQTTPTALSYELSRSRVAFLAIEGHKGHLAGTIYEPARAIFKFWGPSGRRRTPPTRPAENDAAGEQGQERRRAGRRAAAAGVLLGRRRRRRGVGLRRGVQRVDEHRGRWHHVNPGGDAGARGGPRAAPHRRRGRARRRLGGVHAAVHGVGGGQEGRHHVRGGHGRRLRPRRRRRAQRLHRLHHHRHARRLPHHHRGRDVRERRRRGRARRGAAGAVRRAVVDGEGVRAARHRRLRSAAARAPPPCRFAEVHVGHLHPASGGVHAHQPGDRGVRALQGHRNHAEDAPGLHQALLPVRALHRRPRHRRRLHLSLQRAPDPRGAEQDVGHEGGGAHLPHALRRHLRRRGLLRPPPLRGRHHGRRARQLRPQLGRRRPAGAQRRGAPQLRAAPRPRLPTPLLLAPGQRRRAPLPGPPAAGHGRAPVRVPHGRAHGRALRARHRHPQHLDALRVLRVHVRRHHLVDLPGCHCSQGCPWDSKGEGQVFGGDDDHSGCGHEQHCHCLEHHELHQQ